MHRHLLSVRRGEVDLLVACAFLVNISINILFSALRFTNYLCVVSKSCLCCVGVVNVPTRSPFSGNTMFCDSLSVLVSYMHRIILEGHLRRRIVVLQYTYTPVPRIKNNQGVILHGHVVLRRQSCPKMLFRFLLTFVHAKGLNPNASASTFPASGEVILTSTNAWEGWFLAKSRTISK
jgi:hypothetical protein